MNEVEEQGLFLLFFYCKITSDPDNPQEVALITDEKEQILRDIFWEMNTITHSTTTEEVTVIIETDDGNAASHARRDMTHGYFCEAPLPDPYYN